MIRRLLRQRRGAAAAEMALVTPILLVIMFGSVEVGNYFLDEHRLTKAVRDGAVYAARQPIGSFNCGAQTVASGVVSETNSLVRTAYLTTAAKPNQLAKWSDGSTVFTVTTRCQTSAPNGQALSGIYVINSNNVPVVRVTASLPYQPVLGVMGLNLSWARLNATQEAIVVAG